MFMRRFISCISVAILMSIHCSVAFAATAKAVNGVCGPSAGKTFATKPAASSLCNPGTVLNFQEGVASWVWSCQGASGGKTVGCDATKPPPNPCATYFGNGYCVDYIKLKTGKQQSGNAEKWNSNIGKTEVTTGDVAIFSYGHVAYVDSVNKDKKGTVVSVNLSEWNFSNDPMPKVDSSCRVTTKFGKTTTRSNVPLSSVTSFWDPRK
jgi:hypothetical protein